MKCLYPGSFDPVTLGHMDIIRRAAALFEEVYVGVFCNPEKKGLFSPEERVALIEKCCRDLKNVTVFSDEGLTVETAKKLGVQVLIRGIRSAGEWDSEMSLARINRLLCPEIETLFLPASYGMEDVSSTTVRQLASFNGPLDSFLPQEAAETVRKKFQK